MKNAKGNIITTTYNRLKTKGSTVVSKKLARIYIGFFGMCAYCLTEFPGYADWTLDHEIPQSFFIENDLPVDNSYGNLILACKSCNSARGNKTLEDFATKSCIANIKRMQKLAETIDKNDAKLLEVCKMFAMQSRQFCKDFNKTWLNIYWKA